MATINPILEVYRTLERILNNPREFGLGQCAPKALLEELTKSRHALMEELKEQRRWPEQEEDDLEAELSQDADVCMAHRR